MYTLLHKGGGWKIIEENITILWKHFQRELLKYVYYKNRNFLYQKVGLERRRIQIIKFCKKKFEEI